MKCLYTLKEPTKQEAKKQQTLGRCLKGRGHGARRFSGFTTFARKLLGNGAQATQLQTRSTWKEKEKNFHSPNHVTKHGMGSVDENNTHVVDWLGDRLKESEPHNLNPRYANWSVDDVS